MLLSALAHRDASQEHRLRVLLSEGGAVTPGAFWAMAARHEVSPIAARVLRSPALAPYLVGRTTERASDVRMQTLLRNMALHSELTRVADSLLAEGVSVVPLKGTYLCEDLYGSLDGRQVGDIDILVPASQVATARAILRRMGYAPAGPDRSGGSDHPFHGAPLVRRGPAFPFVIEVHWQLTDPTFATVDYERLWRRVMARSRASSLRPLPDEELLLFLSLHLAKHETGILRLLADVDRLVRLRGDALDWTGFVTLAQRWSVPTPAYYALQRSALLLETPVPEAVLRRLWPPVARRVLVDLLAGPGIIIRPPESQHIRYARLWLAYAAMLQPAGRAMRAYRRYMFPASTTRRAGVARRLHELMVRPARGLAWTALGFASGLVDRKRRVSGCSFDACGAVARDTG